MARTIDFDYELALDHAMALFWKHGYAGTTIRELLKAMGIGEGSFYNTLKNKKELYFRCLQRYEETEGRKRGLAFTSAATAAKGIRALFAAILDCLDDPTTPSRLCMQAGMATEEVMADPELRARVERDLSAFHKLVAERLRSDREEGRLSPNADPETISSVVMTFSQGLWRMALVDYDRERFERQVDSFLTALGL